MLQMHTLKSASDVCRQTKKGHAYPAQPFVLTKLLRFFARAVYLVRGHQRLRRIQHTVTKTPFVVIPGTYFYKRAAHHFRERAVID